MTNVTEMARLAEASAVAGERRRPGRPDHVSPELVPLLRGQTVPSLEEEDLQYGEPNQLRAAQGLAVGAALSAGLWVGIVWVGRWILS